MDWRAVFAPTHSLSAVSAFASVLAGGREGRTSYVAPAQAVRSVGRTTRSGVAITTVVVDDEPASCRPVAISKPCSSLLTRSSVC